MKYDVENFTYGVELEFGNCDRKKSLPDKATWNNKDNTCVNSTGIANDPKGILYRYGGEINTRPTDTIQEQIEHIELINNEVPSIVNYRSNLHIHIRVPELKNDLEACKKLFEYILNYQDDAYNITDPIWPPVIFDHYAEALKRMKRNLKSHHYKLPKNRVMAILASTSTQEFYENHAPLTAKGRMWYFSPRAGINLRQMWEETETIEFRHFFGTKNLDEIKSAITWCQQFLNLALNTLGTPPSQLLTEYDYKFPFAQPFEFETEMLYQYTNVDKNPRTLVNQRLEDLREKIDIDDLRLSSKEIYEVI